MNKRLIFVIQFIFLTFFAFSQEIIRAQEEEQIIIPNTVAPSSPYVDLKNLDICPLDKPPRDELTFYPSPAMDLKTEVMQIGWVSPEKFFTVTHDQSFIFDIPKNTKEEIEPTEGYITYVETAWNSARDEDKNRDIFTLTNTDMVSIRKMPLSEKYPTKNLYPESPIRCATISPDGAFVATGHENGKIIISMQLFLTMAIYNTDFYIESQGINALRFSPNSDLLACISREGIIDIWDMHKSQVISSMKTMKDSPYPVYFSADSQHIVSAEDKHTIYERDFNGNITDTLSFEHDLRTYHISDDEKYLFELAQNNNIYVYNMESKKLLGYIPYFSKSEILDFAFSDDYKTILVAHKDGIIFILKTEDVFLNPEVPQPRIGSGSYYGGTGAGKGGSGEISSEIGLHNVDMALNISVPSDPYMISLSPQVSYLYSPLFKPVYYGGSIDISVSIPNPSFPFSYIDLKTGHTIHTPYIIGPKISGVIGYYKKPKSVDIGWFIKFSPAFGLYTFYFPEYGLLDLYPAFAVELQTGINWKQLLIFIGGVYDNRLGASLSGGIGWRIRTGGG